MISAAFLWLCYYLGCFYSHRIIEYSDLKGPTRIKSSSCVNGVFVVLFNGACTRTSSACSSGVSCGVTSRECGVPLQRLCISPALPLVGLKPVLREISSRAHFISSGGNVGFFPMTLAKSLTAFYLSLIIFKVNGSVFTSGEL